MVVLDGRLKSKALACLLFFNFLLVLVRASRLEHDSFKPGNRSRKAVAEIVQQDVLQINKQVTVFLPGTEIKVFHYLDVEYTDHNLSITVIPCGSTLKWSVVYRSFDEAYAENESILSNNEETYEIAAMETVTVRRAKKGVYLLVFYPIGVDALASVYVTMDDGGPYELTIPQNPNLVLTPQRRRRLKVAWEQSLVNPQNTSYCLVVSSRKDYSSVCEAERDGPTLRGFEAPVVVNFNSFKLEKKKRGRFGKSQREMKPDNDTVIVCVQRKMQLTFTKLRKGVRYFVNLFAINNKTNLTIPYGKSFIKYNFTVKPATLKDGVRKVVNLKKMEGKALFRYKVDRTGKKLYFYVLVCGGAVDVKVRVKGSMNRIKAHRRQDYYYPERLAKPTRVFGYRRFEILHLAEGDQVYIKVNAPNVDELTRIKYVEVFTIVHPGKKYPLPNLPEDSNLYEFKSQKTCNSVTIGWIPAADAFTNTYCVIVWKNREFDYADLFRGYFQCDLDEVRRKKSVLSPPHEVMVSKVCEDMIIKNEKSITNHKIRDLNPGTSYTIQVTVKKKSGRTLSYKYLKAHTKHSCEY